MARGSKFWETQLVLVRLNTLKSVATKFQKEEDSSSKEENKNLLQN